MRTSHPGSQTAPEALRVERAERAWAKMAVRIRPRIQVRSMVATLDGA